MQTGNFTELRQTLNPSPVAGQAGCVGGNVIATGCIDSTASQLVELSLTQHSESGCAGGIPGSWTGAPNYQFQYSVPKDTKSFDVRIDHALNDKNHLFGRYSQYIIKNQDPPWTSDPVAGNGDFATAYNIHERSVAIAWDDTLSSSLLNELRFGFNRDYAHSDPIGLQLGTSLAPEFGLTGIPVGPNTAGIPPIEINGLTRIGTSPWRPQFQISQVWQVLDNLSWLKGNHSFKFGYEFRKPSDNFLDIRAPQGEIGINGIYTASGTFGLPDFLLGNVDSTTFVTPTVVHNYMNGNSIYGQDTWRVRPRSDRYVWAALRTVLPTAEPPKSTEQLQPGERRRIGHADTNASGWYNRSLIHPDKNNFAPRVGFSYHPWDRVVFRGGFGFFYQEGVRIGSESILALNPPSVISYSLGQSQEAPRRSFNCKTASRSTTSRRRPSLPLLQIRAQDPNQRTPYVEQASFGPQLQITPNLSLDVSYVGNFARKMNRLRDGNQGIFTGNFDGSGKPIDIYPYANLNTTDSSQTGNHAFLELATNDGNSNYNALLVSLRHRYTKGLAYGISYTWSHNISDYVDNLTGGAEPQNSYDYAAERGDSMFDVRQRFVGFLTYELPVGKGKRFLSDGGVAGYILGGWQVNTIVTKQTGTTIQLFAPDSSLSGGQHISRPDCIGDGRAGASDDPRTGLWLNPAAFALPAAGQFGNCGVGRYHGPGFTNADISLFKIFPIRERLRVEFRSEFFNAFNHANFSNPGSFFPLRVRNHFLDRGRSA